MEDNDLNLAEVPRPKKKNEKAINIMLIVTVILLVIFIVVKIFVIENFLVKGESMMPTFTEGQVIWANKIKSPQINEVIIIEIDGFKVGSAKPKERLIKRVVALSGDTIWSENGVLHRIRKDTTAEEVLDDEKYGDFVLDKMNLDVLKTTLGDNEIFVLGDNRNLSNDSRYFGTIKQSNIIGVVI